MKHPLSGLRPARAALLAGLAVTIAGTVVPAGAQDNMAEARLRRIESEIRALQRNVFQSGEGKVFSPEVTASGAASSANGPGPGQPAATPVTDILTRMEALEVQIKQLTAQSEINANRIAKLEAAAGAAGPATSATPAPAPSPAPSPAASVAAEAAAGPTPTPSPAPTPAPSPSPHAATANMAAMTGGASSPRPAPSPSASARPAAPSPQRLAAVRAIAKPQTADPGDDEYSYGFRLWEAKFYPEAQQQLKLMVDRYPRHPKISFARNLLGRAYLDDGKPREAASWFLQNYQANKAGDRAPDSLLFLAEAMRQLRDTSRACIAVSEFADTYPREAAGRLKGQYDTTRGGLKCN